MLPPHAGGSQREGHPSFFAAPRIQDRPPCYNFGTMTSPQQCEYTRGNYWCLLAADSGHPTLCILHDEDAQNYRWTDDVLDRHIQRSVEEVSIASPREVKATLTTTADSRELSLSTLTDLISIEAVEYPTGKYPPI